MAIQHEVVQRKIDFINRHLSGELEFKSESVLGSVQDIKDTLTRVLENGTADKRDEQWVIDYRNLFQKYDELVEDIIKKAEVENQQLKKDLVEMRKEVENMKARITRMEKEHLNLMAGQLGFEIDRAVVNQVLHGIIEPHQHAIYNISQMEKAIEGHRNYTNVFSKAEDQRKAGMMWDRVKRELGWTEKHFRYIAEIKQLRLSAAHPDFDPKTVRKALESGNLKVPDEKFYLECLGMWETKLNKLATI